MVLAVLWPSRVRSNAAKIGGDGAAEIRSASAGTTNDDDFSEAQEAELAEASAAFQAAQSKARDDAILGEILALRRSHGR